MFASATIPDQHAAPDPWASGGGSWWRGRCGVGWAALFFLALTAAALGSTLLSQRLVFSNGERDLALQFIHWRKFGFDELRAGRLALWNPHVYGGAPYFGGFQSALLYPPNWLYLVLPLAIAINVGVALHVFLAGFGMFLWMRARALHPLAALFAGVLFMFCGPFFPHIYAGHLSNLCTMAWGPFVFLAIDGWLNERRPGWLLLGAATVAMQILAGHPQYVFYTAVAAGLYSAGRLARAHSRLRAAAGLLVIAAAGAALSAVQLFEGFHAAAESVRNHGAGPAFAAKFSFPPENVLTLLVPNFFGSLAADNYWGRWYLWEMSLFFGVTGLVFSLYALARAPRFPAWGCAILSVVLLGISWGDNSPLFLCFYHYAPGFDHFRGWSKLAYAAVVLMVVVAATGYDHLLRRRVAHSRLAAVVLVAGLVLGAAAMLESRSVAVGGLDALQPWHSGIARLAATDEQFLAGSRVDDPMFAAAAARYAVRQCMLAALTLLALAAPLFLARRDRRALAGVLVLAAVEMVSFARTNLDRFPLHDVFDTDDAEFLTAHRGTEFRFYDENSHDLGMSLGTNDLWGYDPGMSRRYAEWMAESQDLDPDAAGEEMKLRRVPPAFATLLRARCILPLDWSPADGERRVTDDSGAVIEPGPRLRLVSRARVLPVRNEELDTIFDPAFAPSEEVLLETAPIPAPAGARDPGSVRLLAETTDQLTMEADLRSPAILLVTDTWSDGWHARSLLPAPGVQPRYQVLPADYCLRGIPLAAGHHRILLEYRPLAFVVGKWVSFVSVVAFLAATVAWKVRASGHRPTYCRRRVPTDVLPVSVSA